ncbi:MAG: hypothetical protein IPN69_07915 [Acidobacteria bacterium]|nr:hypothetical protein [Acidobacteriota bacterium]
MASTIGIDPVSVSDALGNRVRKVDDVWQFVIYDAFREPRRRIRQDCSARRGGVRFYLQDWQASVRAKVSTPAGL